MDYSPSAKHGCISGSFQNPNRVQSEPNYIRVCMKSQILTVTTLPVCQVMTHWGQLDFKWDDAAHRSICLTRFFAWSGEVSKGLKDFLKTASSGLSWDDVQLIPGCCLGPPRPGTNGSQGVSPLRTLDHPPQTDLLFFSFLLCACCMCVFVYVCVQWGQTITGCAILGQFVLSYRDAPLTLLIASWLLYSKTEDTS